VLVVPAPLCLCCHPPPPETPCPSARTPRPHFRVGVVVIFLWRETKHDCNAATRSNLNPFRSLTVFSSPILGSG
jgi:hypothetical protein